MATPPTPADVARAASWLARNLPRIYGWWQYFVGLGQQIKAATKEQPKP